MHSFGDWLRQIKGDTGKKKKSATARQCIVYVGGMGGRRGRFKKKKKRKKGDSQYIYINKS